MELAPVIAGHHAGLKAVGILKDDIKRCLQRDETWEVMRELGEYLITLGPPGSLLTEQATLTTLESEFRTRMLLSALVDADYLNTEQHYRPSLIPPAYPDLKVLWETFERNQKGLIKGLDPSVAQNKVNRVRQEVYQSCCQVATNPPGFYRLTAPTGAGKTRAALAFALKHALSQRTPLDRIVFAIPYTNIIKQTANDYREIFGPLGQVVLEHHSQVEATEGEVRHSIPNWSEPLIITTNVQLFESLFTRRPSKARKLHNLNRSVIILDEAQTLPAHVLEPTLDVLRELVENYGVSVVFCTATQPEYEGAPRLKKNFDALDIKEIVPNYPEHFRCPKTGGLHSQAEPTHMGEVGNRTCPGGE